MIMYAIEDGHTEGHYWNFREGEFQGWLCSECMLPTKEMAFDFTRDELRGKCGVVEVLILIVGDGYREFVTERVEE